MDCVTPTKVSSENFAKEGAKRELKNRPERTSLFVEVVSGGTGSVRVRVRVRVRARNQAVNHFPVSTAETGNRGMAWTPANTFPPLQRED